MATANKQGKASPAPSFPPINLVNEFTRHVLYGLPVGPELRAILGDPERYKQFCEGTSLDPEIQEKYERVK
ncbi:MAG TPA: hypothetical protein VEK33_10635 [Terriglobales bacterium]|nr:hypothetical protein [Terriglobales bacterium]